MKELKEFPAIARKAPDDDIGDHLPRAKIYIPRSTSEYSRKVDPCTSHRPFSLPICRFHFVHRCLLVTAYVIMIHRFIQCLKAPETKCYRLTAYAAFKHCSAYDVSYHALSLSSQNRSFPRYGKHKILSDEHENRMKRI